MKRMLTTIAALAPMSALAHGVGPVGHAHPHGLEIALAAFALGAAASLVPSAWRARRARRDKRR